METHRKIWLALGVLIFLAGFAPASWAQLAPFNSTSTNVNLTATLAESLSVSATPGSVSFNLVASGPATGSSPISVTTTWVVRPNRTSVATYAYFTSSAAALTDGATPPDNIPSANVSGSVNGGANTAFTGTSPFATGSSLTVFSLTVTGASKNSTRTDTVGLTINTAGLNLPAGTYVGTVVIQAQAL